MLSVKWLFKIGKKRSLVYSRGFLYIKIKMAKIKDQTAKTLVKKQVSRPGVHAKTKTSKLKSSKSYKKLYRGQGK